VRRHRPEGFVALAVFAALFGVVMVLAALTADEPHAAGEVGVEAALDAIAVLSFIVAEALWRDRPWAHAASLALAGTVVAVLTGTGLMGMVRNGPGDVMLLVIAAVCAWGVQPLLRYVRDRRRVPRGSP
jgi:hypothetical protein